MHILGVTFIFAMYDDILSWFWRRTINNVFINTCDLAAGVSMPRVFRNELCFHPHCGVVRGPVAALTVAASLDFTAVKIKGPVPARAGAASTPRGAWPRLHAFARKTHSLPIIHC